MAPATVPYQATPPVHNVSVIARFERERQASAAATLALLEQTERVLGTMPDDAMDTSRAEVARQRAEFGTTMQTILKERERIIQQRQANGGPDETHRPSRPVTTPNHWTEQLKARATGLFATNPNASVVWHTQADEQALADILRLFDQEAPERNGTDPAYKDAVTFLRNLNTSYGTTPQALLLRDQLRTITNHEARAKLDYIIDGYQHHPGK